MILLFWFALGALLTWRLASLLARERGAFGLFTVIRYSVGVEHNPDGTPEYDSDGALVTRSVSSHASLDGIAAEIADGVTCVWCNSVWLSLAVCIVLMPAIVPVLTARTETLILSVGGMSAMVIVIDSLVLYFTKGE